MHGVSNLDLFQKCRDFTRYKELKESGLLPYFRPIDLLHGATVIMEGRERIMIGSNNYLGLSHHPKVIEASIAAIHRYGTSCTGSRYLNGTLELHIELEDRLAKFVGKERALVFSTGFQANLGMISSLAGREDVLLCDSENHASIVDGTRLSFAKTFKYRHGDLNDLADKLERFKDKPKMILSDGVFSMSGEIADLPQIVKLANKYNARIFIDDAHAIGVIGERGRGTGEYWDLNDNIDLIMGTFSKSFASLGGFIAGPEYVIDYIKCHSRPFIFSASMPPASIAATLAALEIMETDHGLLEQLWQHAKRMKRELTSLGFKIGKTETPVIPVVLGEDDLACLFVNRLYEEGVFANAIIPPAVPPGSSGVRTSYMATHEDKHLDKVLEVFNVLGKEFNLI